MHVLVVLGHPDPNSFNHAIADAVLAALREAHHEVWFHDLHAEGFDPCLPAAEAPSDAALPPDIAEHCAQLAAAEGIVVVHPNWWGMPPAVMKGWIDRVMRPGVAYRFEEGDGGEGVPIGLLQARAALILNTANTPEQREREVFGDPLETIWRNCVFGLCGVHDVRRRTFGVVCTSSAEQREEWLDEVRALVTEAFPA